MLIIDLEQRQWKYEVRSTDNTPTIANIMMTVPTIRFNNHIPRTNLNHFFNFATIYVMPNHQRTAPIPMHIIPPTNIQTE